MQIAEKSQSDKTTRELRKIAVEIRREKHTAKVNLKTAKIDILIF
jgi:hypothetical protein